MEVSVTPELRVLAVSSPGVQPGKAATVAFRPEKVRINAESSEGEANHASGTVTEVVYIGSQTAYEVRLPDSTQVAVRQQNLKASFDTVYHPGDEVTLSWPLVGCKAFVDEGADA